jgi:predicted RND superfamily exporter protein
MNFSDVPPFHDLGNITSVGMAAAFLFSVSTLPALMSLLPVRVKAQSTELKQSNTWMDRLGSFVVANNKRLLWGTTFGIIGLTLLISRNELNDQFVEYFDNSIQFRTDTDFISDNLTGIYTLEFSLGAGESGGVNNPEYLKALASFEQWLKKQEEVVHVNSYVDVARRVNKSMHGDSLKYYNVPSNREEAAQYLLLYEMSLPFGLDLNNQINVDKSETRLTATLENVSSEELIALAERSENWLKANTPEYMFTNGISTALMFSHLSKRQIGSMISGTTIALVLISIILMLALGSFKYGLMSLIPNITPVLTGFGVWAMVDGMVDTGIAIVFGMTLGIIVDDTVHFISKYLRARREHGKSPEDAVRYAFRTVGQALVVTTVVLIAGFAILAQSSFGMNAGMAQITVIIITLALVIDFLLLPGLLILMSKTRKEKELVPAILDDTAIKN